MALLDTSGHILNVGDKVKMNIPFIGSGDLDGVEITADGKNYWRYMNEHPYEVYTIVGFDFSNENEVSYILDGYMGGNNWYSDELIHVPKPESRYEVLKNMSLDEMTRGLIPFLAGLMSSEDLSEDFIRKYLSEKI